MLEAWKWPERTSVLDFSGDVPHGLDGLLLLPSVRAERVHVLRVGDARPLWYSALTRAQLRELPGVLAQLEAQPRAGSDLAWWTLSEPAQAEPQPQRRWIRTLRSGLRVYVSRRAGKLWRWQLCDAGDVELEAGMLATEHATEIDDVIVTPHHLLVVATDYTASSTAQDIAPTHRVGIAARLPRARVHWLHGDPVRRPQLHHAHEVLGNIVVELGWPDSVHARGIQLARWTIDPRELQYQHEELCRHALRADTLAWGPRDGAWSRSFALTAEHASERPRVLRLDSCSSCYNERSFSFGHEPSAPTLCQLASGAHCVMLSVYDAVRDVAECLLLDADDIAGPPLATIRLPVAVRCDARPYFVAPSV